jgi:hypothetical protein
MVKWREERWGTQGSYGTRAVANGIYQVGGVDDGVRDFVVMKLFSREF